MMVGRAELREEKDLVRRHQKQLASPNTEAKERRKRRKREAQGREVMVGIFSVFSGGYMAKPSHHPSLHQLILPADLIQQIVLDTLLVLPLTFRQPVCGMSKDEGELKESFTASLQTVAESSSSSIGNEERVAELTRPRTDRKRHPVRDHPPPPSPNYSIFQVFHQCKQFEA
ncbi:hypothetical protein GW17_00002812 [Ensete ventricosum]|nr:hypothetical protein GW17_00002812 [Ensete ventricosum]